MQRSKSSGQNVAVDMAAHHPIEIGTKGTVGSLVMQEIEYFNMLELELSSRESSKKPHGRPIVGPVVAAEKKKKRGASKLVASICSMVEVSENRPVGVSGSGFRNLKSDSKKLEI
ncbi:hypothetical protein E1A91_A04G022900v1 [Gossypium mustelinum]|uniref:Uncharacterized protein n=4 Tax=Gossypium TaxID=3633 RepID=A0A5J5W3J7_GOSBA|nr:hypothetical protein ES319_A04G021600v1 [Gossypium barbadense]TYH21217.1 hypothetical protein ES288_A04G025700v1 [Gossypium darwinii]TYI31982.1 hypothetical protein ES332_A04G025400v1 [Gossypium tomentosum]TYJ38859.1 hypothetical protein E1A91_A04G022900v1 [Gossypium mustelinum]